MTNLIAFRLDGQAGRVAPFSQMTALGVVLTGAPAGALTLTGVTQNDGTPQPWTTNAAGWSAAPGSGKAFGGLQFDYSDPADKGLAYLIVQPT
ncbi:MAG: hypothetical protein KGL50_06100 [Burkholderiales bacterium]|nr:hypothetical protein [Burkholderiales bacterium]